MDTNDLHVIQPEPGGTKYAPDESAQSAETLALLPSPLGQREPQHYPQQSQGPPRPSARDPLGEPMSIREVARLLGCSVWTVRNRILPAGLPHFRLGATGTLRFFRQQVVQWVLQKQHERQNRNHNSTKKGGTRA